MSGNTPDQRPQTPPIVPVAPDPNGPPIQQMQIAPAPNIILQTQTNDATLKTTPVSKMERWETALVGAESLYSLILYIACTVVVLAIGISYFNSKLALALIKLAETISENWKAAIILLFPTVRSTWRRIEHRISEFGWLKMNAGTPVPAKETEKGA